MEQIVAKSVEATGQAKLRAALKELKDTWSNEEFMCKNYKERDNQFILVGIDELYTVLDESIAQINMILGNRYVKVMRAEAETMKKTLNTLQETVTLWVDCQRQWCYLENIFQAQDIKKNLAKESTQFDAVDKFFKQTMTKASKIQANCFRFLRANPRIVEDFTKNNGELEYIQKKLEDYMEVKRGVFPRFYFLSNDDLLEILANSDNKDVISLHLKTLFDGLVRLTFKDDSIMKMHSKEGEDVELTKPVRMKNGVENWLQNLQDEMKITVQRKLRDG